MKHFDTEKAIASLQRRLDAAVNRSNAIAARYLKVVSKIYLDPRFWNSTKPVATTLPESEYDFVTRYDRENLFRNTYDSGFGYREYRTISKSTFARLERLEVRLLNAWEVEQNISWQLQKVKKANPTLGFENVA